MKLIVAVDSRWGIGKNGDLLKSIPDDMLYYRATTRGKVVVMGYTTLLSLPNSKPAPGRLNLVLADIPGLRVSGAVVCSTMEQLHRLIGCFAPDDVFDIGGGSMYRQLLPYCCAAHITKMRFDGDADTYIPDLDALPEWSVESESELKEHEGTPYSFVVYKNAAPMALPEAAHKSTDMSEYFRKREPIAVDLFDDEAYKSELLALLNAYYHPLADGFGAEDVDRFFSEGSDRSFEQYLRDRRLIAAPEDFEALANTFSPDKAEAKHRICVTKEALDDFASSLTLSAALLADRFKA